MQNILKQAREKLAIRHAATMADATADLDTWYAKKQARIAKNREERDAKQAAGMVRIRIGYMVDPKTGLVDVPEDEPTNLDITKYNPKTVAKVSTAYQEFLRLNPTEYQAVEYLQKLLQKNNLPKEFGTAKQSKKFSGGNDAV
jgi:peptidoglycan hydrolase-like protein with peptidoglycan-binding domain